jgi:hypothetical protein
MPGYRREKRKRSGDERANDEFVSNLKWKEGAEDCVCGERKKRQPTHQGRPSESTRSRAPANQ